MKMWLTSKDTIKYELSPKETKQYKDFKTKVNNIRVSETRSNVNLNTDYNIQLSFIESSIGYSVYVECEALGLKKNITDYSTW